ncbi:MAG: hypothetical protein AB7S38_20175 [Vulcanimicrobiota bacterium]
MLDIAHLALKLLADQASQGQVQGPILGSQQRSGRQGSLADGQDPGLVVGYRQDDGR